MAKTKSKAKKLSRRELVSLLGSGVVLAGTAGSGSVEAQTTGKAKAKATTPPPPPPGPNACQTVVPFKGRVGSGPAAHTILMADPCCREGVDLFFTGFDKVANPAKGHLKEFAAALTTSKDELLEYCVMVWGLKLEERADLMKQMQEKYQLKEYSGK
jgi:hypothetical protein